MLFNRTEDAVLLVAGLCSTFAVVISSLLIRKHLVHFSRPVVQVLCATMCAVCSCSIFAHVLDVKVLVYHCCLSSIELLMLVTSFT